MVRYHSRFFVRVGHEIAYTFSLYHVIVRPTKIIKDLCKASILGDSIYTCTRFKEVLINLLGLTMTCFSERMMISYSYICGFMLNLQENS